MRLELILTFIVSLLLLKQFFYKSISPLWILQFTCILIILLIAIDYRGPKPHRYYELFEDASPEKLHFLETLVQQEDSKEVVPQPLIPPVRKTFDHDYTLLNISDKKITFYFTVFSNKSMVQNVGNELTKKWWNLVDTTSQTALSLTFENVPNSIDQNVYNGMFLGDNKIKGPFCNALGLNNTSYTLFIMFKPGNLLNEGRNDNTIFDLINLYNTDSSDNSALSVSLQGVNTSSAIQTAKVSVGIGNNPAQFCVLRQGISDIPFDIDVTYVYAFVFDNTRIKVYRSHSTSIDKSMTNVLEFSITQGTASLSNRPMEINRSGNCQLYLKAFGGYNSPLSNTDLNELSKKLFDVEKEKDIMVTSFRKQVSDLESQITNMTQCPMDLASCSKCSDIKNWGQPQLFTTASEGCLTQVQAFCKQNPNHNMCKCWNLKNEEYNSNRCVNFRKLIGNETCYDIANLKNADLEEIKRRYNLQTIPPPTVNTPTPTPTPTPPPPPPPPTITISSPTPSATPTPKASPDNQKCYLPSKLGLPEDEDDILIRGMLQKLKAEQPKQKPMYPKPTTGDHYYHDYIMNPPRGLWDTIKSLFSYDDKYRI